MELYAHTAHHLNGLLRKGEVSSKEITESVFHRVDQVEPRLNAYITLMRESAFRQAERADRMIATGEIGPFTGIPLGIKDIICMRNVPTTCGSKALDSYKSPYDATTVRKLRETGAVFVGKTNMDEFAMGSSTEMSAMGCTKNPWNAERTPGGSSGGSAAATAARECIASLGSDTGGSVRQPASHCGIVGLKPTYGRVSRYGLVAFASSLDQIGPMTLDVRDCALLLRLIGGYDPRDSTSASRHVPDYESALGKDLRGLKVGLPREYFGEGLDREVKETVDKARRDLESLGVHTLDVSLPHTKYAVASYYIIAPAEASSNLARYDGVRHGHRTGGVSDIYELYEASRSDGFGPEVIRRIMLGTYVLSAGYYDAYYKKASQVRTLFIKDFKKAFESCDVLLAPVAPTPAFGIGEKVDDPLTMYLTDIFTISANLAGIPAMSLPYGMSAEGLPIGVQLMGDFFDEETILQVAYAIEQRTSDWKGRLPALK